jgi:ribosomal protein L23
MQMAGGIKMAYEPISTVDRINADGKVYTIDLLTGEITKVRKMTAGEKREWKKEIINLKSDMKKDGLLHCIEDCKFSHISERLNLLTERFNTIVIDIANELKKWRIT